MWTAVVGTCVGIVLLPAVLPSSWKLRYYVCMASYALGTHLMVIVTAPFTLLSIGDVKHMRFIHYLSIFLTKIAGLKFELRGKFPENKKYIMVCNHQSVVDFYPVFYFWDNYGKFTIVTKLDVLKKMGLIGMYSYLTGHMYVDKNKTGSTPELQKKTKQFLDSSDGKASVLIFPEGRRSMGEQLQPFRKGCFVVSRNLNLPVVPVVISPFYFLKESCYFRRGKIIMQVLDPIMPTRDCDEAQMAQKTWTVMNDAFQELKKELVNK